MSDRNHSDSQMGKMWSALFYGVSSILVIFTNKWLLTEFHFPHFKFVATAQFVATSVILLVLALFKKVDIPFITPAIFREIMPISLMFLGNVLFGLGSTKALNIPMFTALRRFSILMTMLGEWYMLNSKPHSNVVISVALMVGGAMLAAMYDLAFDASGYSMVFLNNIFTAMNGIYLKKASMSGKCSKMGVLFYNSLFSALIMSAYFIGEHNYYANRQAPAGSMKHHQHELRDFPQVQSAAQLGSKAVLTAEQQSAWLAHQNQKGKVWVDQELKFIREAREDREEPVARVLLDLPAPQLRGGSSGSSGSAPYSGPQSGHQSSELSAPLSELEKAQLRLQALNQQISSETARYALLQAHQQGQGNHEQGGGRGGGHPAAHATAMAVNERIGATTDPSNQSTISLVMAYQGWSDWSFISMLLGTCCMGSVLNYAIFLCTTRNSALTTAVVGTMKNVFTTYIGMMVFSDYTFTWVNFLGINISILGSLYYTYCTMKS